MTTRDGLDSTLTLVTVCRASRMRLGWVSDPDQEVEPGKRAVDEGIGDRTPRPSRAPVVGSILVAGAVAAWVPRNGAGVRLQSDILAGQVALHAVAQIVVEGHFGDRIATCNCGWSTCTKVASMIR